jgi:hypothetical protein
LPVCVSHVVVVRVVRRILRFYKFGDKNDEVLKPVPDVVAVLLLRHTLKATAPLRQSFRYFANLKHSKGLTS